MSIDLDDNDRFENRKKQQENSKKKGIGMVPKVIFGTIGILLSAFIVIGPSTVSEFFNFKTSDSQELQESSRIDTGISTELPAPRRQEIETEVEALEIPADIPEREVGLSEEEKARIAELERQLASLKDQEKGITAEQIKELLDAQRKAIMAEVNNNNNANDLEAQALAQRLKEEAAARERARLAQEEARKRLEERRKEAAELRKKQLDSDGVLFDDSVGGVNAGEASEEERDVREFSQDEKFLRDQASSTFETSTSKQLSDLKNLIVQGTIISAALETAINTELPGNLRAQVTEDVYSYDGEKVLMPKGTRLIGTFSSDINIAQKRVLIAWNRAITPSGISVELGSTGVDRLGRSGTRGNVDTRFFERFGTAVLITTIAAIPSFLASESDDANVQAANDLATDASQNLQEQTQETLQDYLSLPPIIRVPQGQEIMVFVNRDLRFF